MFKTSLAALALVAFAGSAFAAAPIITQSGNLPRVSANGSGAATAKTFTPKFNAAATVKAYLDSHPGVTVDLCHNHCAPYPH